MFLSLEIPEEDEKELGSWCGEGGNPRTFATPEAALTSLGSYASHDPIGLGQFPGGTWFLPFLT